MKIGLLSYRSNPFSGGQGIYVRHLSSALVKLGHQVDVISGPPYPELHQGVNLIKIPSLNLFALEDNQRLRSFRFRFFIIFKYEYLYKVTIFRNPNIYNLNIN